MRQVADGYRELSGLALSKKSSNLVAATSYLEKELALREAVYRREPAAALRAQALAQCLASLVKCSPRNTIEERNLAQSRLEQAVRCLDGVQDPGSSEPELERLRASCMNQIEQLKRLNSEMGVRPVETREN